jgi:hypothetical protein
MTIRSLLLALSAAGALAIAAEPAAAKVHVNVGIGVPIYAEPYPVYPAYPVVHDYDDDYAYDEVDEDCGYEYRKIRKWNRYHDSYRIVRKRVWVCR